MPGYVPIHPVVGVTPMNDIFTPDATQRWPMGMVIDAVDPYFGFGRFAYLQSGAAYDPGILVTLVDQTGLVQALATTANLGQNFYAVRQVFGAANQWGWFQFQGIAPVQVVTGVAQGAAIGIGTAGKASTNSAGKQLLGATVLQAATFTLTKLGQTQSGSKQLGVSNIDGLFKGLAVTGTGIAGASTVASLDVSGRVINLNNNMTATGTATITFTWTGFNMLMLSNPHTQGAIT